MKAVVRRMALVAAIAAMMVGAFAPVASADTYPKKVRHAFVSACVKGGAQRDVCKCAISEIQQKYSYDEFKKIARRIKRTNKLPKGIRKIVKSCAQQQG